MWKLFVVITAGFLLVSCQGPFLPIAQQRCTEYGFTSGTEAFARCLQQEFIAEDEKQDRQLQILQEGLDDLDDSWRTTTCYTTGSVTTCY